MPKEVVFRTCLYVRRQHPDHILDKSAPNMYFGLTYYIGTVFRLRNIITVNVNEAHTDDVNGGGGSKTGLYSFGAHDLSRLKTTLSTINMS